MPQRAPSTPNARSLRSQPSTTPAGPPPTWLTDKSTTPAGPPPSNFGSSYNPSNNTFGKRGFSIPDDEDNGEEDDADYDEDDDMSLPARKETDLFLSSVAAPSPRGFKRSRDGKVRDSSGMAAIARGLTSKSKAATLTHNEDEVVLQAERSLSTLLLQIQDQPRHREQLLTDASSRLKQSWRAHAQIATKQGTIGPQSDDGFTKANYIASLLLEIHYPSVSSDSRGELHASHLKKLVDTKERTQRAVTLPRALLTWLDTYHRPFPDDFDDVHLTRPAPSAHDGFWDVVYANVLRGKFDRVARLLKDADWQHAATAEEDGAVEDGYNGIQLRNTEEVAEQCVHLLQTSPGWQNGDWDIKGHDWIIFRQRAHQALEDLEDLAEGANLDRSRGENVFQRSAASSGMGLSSMSRRAESKVPWTIYENMKLLYGLLLGSVEDIMMASQDWLEASIYLTVWWDGNDDAPLDASLNRMGLRKNKTREVDLTPLAAYRKRLAHSYLLVTEAPEDAVFQPNTMDSVQLALACVIEDSVGTVIGVLRTWSATITTAIVELADLGGWLPTTAARPSNLLEQGFSKEDLLVFSHGPGQSPETQIDRDAILEAYADQIRQRDKVLDKEGWELAISVLKRLDDADASREKIRVVLDKLELSDADRVDKVLEVCDQLGLVELRHDFAERFADSFAETTQSYGSALIYYARAHAATKIKDTLALLTSLCLLHSTAMPPAHLIDDTLKSLLGQNRPALRDLAQTDLEAATLLSSHLSGYASLRSFYELRDHELNLKPGNHVHPPMSLKRRREAAALLANIITAAADCIPGGLYDPAAESILPVEGLLVLLGEALPFLGATLQTNSMSSDTKTTPARVFTKSQVFSLLRIVEDVTAAPGRIRENADSLLRASLSAHRDEFAAPSGVLKRTASGTSSKANGSMTGSSSWELLAESSMLTQSRTGSAKIEVHRAWDWRTGAVAVGGVGLKGDELILILREGLVREVGSGWGGLLGW